MARITAKNVTIFADARDISARCNSVTQAITAEAPEVTCFTEGWRSRLSEGFHDTEFSLSGFHDGAASSIDDQLRPLVGGSAWFSVYFDKAGASKPGNEFVGILSNYSLDAPFDGAITFSATITGSGRILGMTSLGHQTLSDAGASDLSSIDFGAETACTAWHCLRIITLTGTTPVFSASLQESADDTSFATIGEWNVTSANQIYSTTTASCSRYRRLSASLEGTSPCCTFMISSGSEII